MNEFFRDRYDLFIFLLTAAMIVMLLAVTFMLYAVQNRPIPLFQAQTPDGQSLQLIPHDSPNLTSSTLIKWASAAAVAAYTFGFVDYNDKLALARPYFTEAGWVDYIHSLTGVIETIEKNQLFVNSVVSGPPVISNQGVLPGRGYAWRIQMPFLVTYQSAETTSRNAYTVSVTVVRVPTWVNPDGIGIDQFVMNGA